MILEQLFSFGNLAYNKAAQTFFVDIPPTPEPDPIPVPTPTPVPAPSPTPTPGPDSLIDTISAFVRDNIMVLAIFAVCAVIVLILVIVAIVLIVRAQKKTQ
jgi:hypothetical protein